MNIADHILHLLRRNDFVIVPGLGAFIADRESARLSADGFTFFPPRRTLSFNPDIAHNDGLLVTSVMRRTGCTHAAATALIDEAVGRLRASLASAGSVSFGMLGRFEAQEQGTPLFLPASESAIDPLSALPVLTVEPMAQAVSPADEPEETLPAGLLGRFTTGVTSWGRVAAAVAVITVCGICLAIGIKRHSGSDVTLAAIPAAPLPSLIETAPAARDLYIAPAPEGGSAQVTPVAPIKTREEAATEASAGSLTPQAVPAEAPAKTASATASAAKTATATKTASAAADCEAKYLLVVASLPSMDAARRFIAADGNSELRVAQMGSRYRVYIASSASKEALVALQPDVARRYQGAWVCANN